MQRLFCIILIGLTRRLDEQHGAVFRGVVQEGHQAARRDRDVVPQRHVFQAARPQAHFADHEDDAHFGAGRDQGFEIGDAQVLEPIIHGARVLVPALADGHGAPGLVAAQRFAGVHGEEQGHGPADGGGGGSGRHRVMDLVEFARIDDDRKLVRRRGRGRRAIRHGRPGRRRPLRER